MQQGNLNDLLAFLAVGQERSFTKAAAKLGAPGPFRSATTARYGRRETDNFGFEKGRPQTRAATELQSGPAPG
jgi:hypothetical protein